MTEGNVARRTVAALTAPGRRRPAADWRSLEGLDAPGLYAWFVDPSGASELSDELAETVEPGLIYGGQAGAGSSLATLRSRIGGNHIGGNIYGSTFRLTLASALIATLGLEPVGGRRMTAASEARLSTWMLEHLSLAINHFEERLALAAHESEVLTLLDPPLNLSKVGPTSVRATLSARRRAYTAASAIGAGAPPPMARATRRAPSSADALGPTPEELASELGLPNAKQIRGYLRNAFPRDPSLLWSRWGPLEPELANAVRRRFGGRR